MHDSFCYTAQLGINPEKIVNRILVLVVLLVEVCSRICCHISESSETR